MNNWLKLSLLLLCLPLAAWGQGDPYRFTYQFQLPTIPKDTSAYKLRTVTQEQGHLAEFKFKVTDVENYGLPGVSIQLLDEKGKEIAHTHTDVDGQGSFKVLAGTYALKMRYVGFADLDIADLVATPSSINTLTVKLGMRSTLLHGTIHSKRRLKKSEKEQLRRDIQTGTYENNPLIKRKTCQLTWELDG